MVLTPERPYHFAAGDALSARKAVAAICHHAPLRRRAIEEVLSSVAWPRPRAVAGNRGVYRPWVRGASGHAEWRRRRCAGGRPILQRKYV